MLLKKATLCFVAKRIRIQSCRTTSRLHSPQETRRKHKSFTWTEPEINSDMNPYEMVGQIPRGGK